MRREQFWYHEDLHQVDGMDLDGNLDCADEPAQCPAASIHRLKVNHPGYLWSIPSFQNVSTEQFGDIPEKVMLSGRSRSILREVGFPCIYWEPFLKYCRLLMWADVEACKEFNWKVSFAELALDYELVTAQKLEDPGDAHNTTWGRKAEIMNLMFKLLFKYSHNFDKDQWPRERVPAFSAFGLRDKVQGFARRPKFLRGDQTERLVALNVLGVLREREKCERLSKTSLWRHGPLKYNVDYNGFRLIQQIPELHPNRKTDLLAACSRSSNAYRRKPLGCLRRLEEKGFMAGRRTRLSIKTSVFTKRVRLRGKTNPSLGIVFCYTSPATSVGKVKQKGQSSPNEGLISPDVEIDSRQQPFLGPQVSGSSNETDKEEDISSKLALGTSTSSEYTESHVLPGWGQVVQTNNTKWHKRFLAHRGWDEYTDRWHP